MRKIILLGAFFHILFLKSMAQISKNEDSSIVFPKVTEALKLKGDDKEVQLVQMLQLWDVATFTNSGGTAEERRNDIYIRRGRTGIRGKIRKDINFNFILAYDGIGRDKNTAGNGNININDNREVYLWDGFLTWNMSPLVNITAGYFRPQVGRENITAAFRVISFEKSLANFQPRTHLLNRNTGRETGVNLGGLYLKKGWSLNYNIGIFDLTNDKIIGSGKYWSPLLASRVALTIGDPEMESYRINYVQSYYGKRKGITLAVNGTYNGKTEIFTQNGFYGVDVLANYGKWDFNAEYDWLYRNSTLDSATTHFTTDKVLSLRLGYNFILKNGKIIQLSGMYSSQLAMDYGKDSRINSMTKASDQEVYDVGINYLINKDNLKLNLHYVWGKRNQNFEDPNYSYLGLGLQFLI